MRIDSQRLRDIEEFHDVHAPFADFDAGDLGLRGSETSCELGLRKLRCLTGGDEGCAQRAMATTPERFQFWRLPFSRARTYNAKTELGDF